MSEELNPNTGPAVTAATVPAKKPEAKKAPAKKPEAKKAPAKKPEAKKAPAKKPEAKKPVKKAPAKKADAKKPVKKAAPVSKRGKGPAGLRNQLHAMLLRKLPQTFRIDKQSLDFAKIAKGHKMTIEGVYKWFRSDRVTPVGAMQFVQIGGGKLKLADFHPFVFKK